MILKDLASLPVETAPFEAAPFRGDLSIYLQCYILSASVLGDLRVFVIWTETEFQC